MTDRDIERFIKLVKKEADKEEDFVEDRIKTIPLYTILQDRYDNFDEIVALALKKSEWLERLKDAMEYIWKKALSERAYRETDDVKRDRLIKYVSFQPNAKTIYEKCVWRYGKEEVEKMALSVVKKYQSNGRLYGKYKTMPHYWGG